MYSIIPLRIDMEMVKLVRISTEARSKQLGGCLASELLNFDSFNLVVATIYTVTDMSLSYGYTKILLIVLLIVLTVFVISPQFGAACRPLQDELLLKLPRGPKRPSSPDPIHP
ncbi:hypothetical protein VNO77_16412 [Canavalia gladiata]|uniref:Uncharacterized protein n=1 Tax=Canavalia gladiata TaxID=3824 RepID=A0AAN9QT26_CANGL